MAMFDYKGQQNSALIEDALIMNAYSSELAGFKLEKSFATMADEKGWKVLNAEDIGYAGSSDGHDIFNGEYPFFWSSQLNVFGKYDESGKLTGIGVCYWGTGDVADSPTLTANTTTDAIHDLMMALNGFAEIYVQSAFNELLTTLAQFAKDNGLTGQDVTFSGMSLGGAAVNSTAMASSKGEWNGFYEDSNYIAISSPVQNTYNDNVLNIGCENDPVYRLLEGTSVNFPDTLLVHDKPLETCINNLVMFNDYYAADVFTIFSVANQMGGAWAGHDAADYVEGLKKVMDSTFYTIMNKDSTVIVSRMSDEIREKTWLEDLNKFANPHVGPTHFIGSDKNDKIIGGQGMDYIEAGAGDDLIRDEGGYNVILGGEGIDTFAIAGSTTNYSWARDDVGNLFMKDVDGGITILYDVEKIKGGWLDWLVWKELTYDVTETGLSWDKGFEAYAATYSADMEKDSLVVAETPANLNKTSWLFGYHGDDTLQGTLGDDVFMAGQGNDLLYGYAGKDSFIMLGDNFGHDVIHGFGSDDKLIFMASSEFGATPDFHDYLSSSGNDTLFTVNENSSIRLVGVNIDQLSEQQFAMA